MWKERFALRKFSRLLMALSVVATLALFAAGCGNHGAAKPPADNILRISMETAPVSFDSAVIQDVDTSQLLQQIYEGLVQLSPDNKLVPCLADSWKISPDGKTYTFHLRSGVKFQNGQPLTAADVAYSLARPLDPALASPVALTYLGDIVGAQDVAAGKAQSLAGVKVIDPQTLSITITQPKSYWINTLTYPTACVVCKSAVAALGHRRVGANDLAQGIATGPFQLTRYQQDREVDLAANRSYWDGAPLLAGQKHIIVADAGTRHALFASGQLDIMGGEEFGDLKADKANPVLKNDIRISPRASTMYLSCNENVYAPFKDVRVRQALAYATDKEKLRQRATEGSWSVAGTLLPPGIFGSDPNYKGIPFDLAKAKTLLAEAGYPGGNGLPPLRIYYNEKTVYTRTTVDLMRQMYSEIGINVQAQPMEWGALLSAINKNTILPSFCLAWVADYLDPQDFYSLLLTSSSPENHNGYKNSQLDALCAQADVEPGHAKRVALYQKIEVIATEDSSRIPLLHESSIDLVQPYVKGIQDTLMGDLPYKKVSFAK